MSQQRARKNSGVREAPIVRPSLARASRDTAVPTTHPKNNERSKNKIPKAIRYDLENALVGLCDVWFEDIKPYLTRNNIKLHVNDAGGLSLAGNNGALPSGAPGCSHLDPGAAPDDQLQSTVNCASCYSTRRTASRAPCPRQTAEVQANHPDSQNKKSKQRSSKLKPNKSQTLVPASPRTSSKLRVSRACSACTFQPTHSTSKLLIRIPNTIKNPSGNHKNKQYRKGDNNRDTDKNSVNSRLKILKSILCDEEIETDQCPEIPKLNIHQINNRKMKKERSPNHGVPFGSFFNSKVKFKKMDYKKYGLRRISSLPVGLFFNNYEKSSGNKLRATRCIACRIQNSDSKIHSKQHSNVKSQRRRQDVDVQQRKPRVSVNSKRANGINDDHRTKNASRPEFTLHKELNRDKRPVVEIQSERSFYNEDELETERLFDIKMSRKESTTNAQAKSLRRRDGTIQPGRYPVPGMPDLFIDTETPSTTERKRHTEESKVFRPSLIDIISKEQNKRVKQLLRNQATDTPTALILATGSSKKYHKKVRNVKKKPPWK